MDSIDWTKIFTTAMSVLAVLIPIVGFVWVAFWPKIKEHIETMSDKNRRDLIVKGMQGAVQVALWASRKSPMVQDDELFAQMQKDIDALSMELGGVTDKERQIATAAYLKEHRKASSISLNTADELRKTV